jgi:hypothetical protein
MSSQSSVGDSDSEDSNVDDIDAEEYEVDYLINEDLVEAMGGRPGEGGGSGGGGAGHGRDGRHQKIKKEPTYWSMLYGRLDNMNSTQLLLMILTIIALFGDDFRILLLPKSADGAFSAFVFVIFLIFGLEWAAQCMFKPDYTYSLFFWLDLLATISLITDVIFLSEWIFGEVNNIETIQQVCVPAALHDGPAINLIQDADAGSTGQMARTGRAARVATRTARLIRIVRVLRVLRVFKIFKFFGGFGGAGQGKDGEKGENELKSSTTKMGARLAERISQRVIIVVLSLFVGVVMVLQGYETIDAAPAVGLDWMVSMRQNATYTREVDGSFTGERRQIDRQTPSDKTIEGRAVVLCCAGC